MRYAIVISAIILALFCRAFLVSVYKVSSQSMAPAILAGDFILGFQTSYGLKFPWSHEVYFASQPQRGDLIAYSKGSKIYIKRVIATGSESVEYKAGEFYINSKKCNYTPAQSIEGSDFSYFDEKCGDISHKIIRPSNVDDLPEIQFTQLESSQLYVVSDNRDFKNKLSSAEIIRVDQIIGKPVLIWMSYSSTQDFISQTLGVRWNRILTNLR